MTTDLDQLLREANPAPQPAVDRLDLGDAPDLLRDTVLATDPTADPAADHDTPSTSKRRRRWPLLLATSSVIAVAALFIVASVDRIDHVSPSPSEAWAASAVKVARAVPRLLPSEHGWHVTRSDEFDVEYGEFEVANGNRAVQLTWYRRDQYDTYFKDRQPESKRFSDALVAGETAAVFRYDKTSDDYFAMWKTGDHFVEARVQPDIPPEWKNKPMPAGEGMGAPTFVSHFDEPSFRRFLTGLKPATIDAWLTAMPASVVKPQDNRAAVAKMLDGVPTPKGFDSSRLVDESAIRDRYQLGAHVAGAVLCSWVKEWEAAKAAGDGARQLAARRAMGTAPSWSVFKEMGPDGAAPEILGSDAVAFSKLQTPNQQLSFGDFYHRQFCQTM